MEGLTRRMDGFLQRFSKIPQLSLLENFPHKEHEDLNGPSLNQLENFEVVVENINGREIMTEKMNEKKIENNLANNSYTHSMVSMPKMEISIFDGKNSR